MKKILLVTCIFALAACSSKKDSTMLDEASAKVEQAAPAMPETPEVPAAPEPQADPAPAMDNMASNSNFPAITGTERAIANCTVGSVSRTVTVLDITGNNGCGVVYTKNGNPTTIAIARHDMSYCDRVFENVKSNLSAGGYDCGEGVAASAPAASAPVEETAKESTISEEPAAVAEKVEEAAPVVKKEAVNMFKKATEEVKEKSTSLMNGAADRAKAAAEAAKNGE